jgi:hypothetical protein
MTQPVGHATPASARYYTPAARFDRVRLVIALPVAIVLAAAIGCAYAVVEFQLNSVHFRVAGACAAAAVLGGLTAGLLSFARVHHRGLALLFGTLVGSVGLWASWVAWVHRLLRESGSGPSPVELATSPRLLFELVQVINAVGVWRYGGNTYRGTLLAAIWLVEALILVLGCVLIASHVGKPGVFCPACRKRCTRTPGTLGRFDGHDTSGVRPRLEAGDFEHLLALGPVRHEDHPEVGLELLQCPCGQTNVLNASRIAWEGNDQGGVAVKVRPIVEGLLLTPEQVEHVSGLRDRLPPAADEESDAGTEDEAAPVAPDVGEEASADPADDPYAERRPPPA